MDRLSDDQVKEVKELFHLDQYDKIHTIYKNNGVYLYNSCETCQKNDQIKAWTTWAIEHLWQK